MSCYHLLILRRWKIQSALYKLQGGRGELLKCASPWLWDFSDLRRLWEECHGTCNVFLRVSIPNKRLFLKYNELIENPRPSLIFSLTTSYLLLHRLREQHPSERDIISLTHLVADVERSLFTFRRRHAVLADTLPRKWGISTGVKKQKAGALLELVAWSTWRPWVGDSKTVSGKAPKPRSNLRKQLNHN